jgi:hypothetical protein
MSQSGDADQVTIVARAALIEVVNALGPQAPAAVVCGGQAVALRTPDFDLRIQPYTKDADLALDPILVLPEPSVPGAMKLLGFEPDQSWPGNHRRERDGALVDLVVPQTLGEQSAKTRVRHALLTSRESLLTSLTAWRA